MTHAWVPLRAQDGGPMGPCFFEEARHPCPKFRGCGNQSKSDSGILGIPWILGFTPERLPQVQVADPFRLHSLSKRSLVELGVESAVRGRPHIAKRLDPMRTQERQKIPERVIGVADGEERRHFFTVMLRIRSTVSRSIRCSRIGGSPCRICPTSSTIISPIRR